ncbi:endonuclease/exonuclease/phosphatase family protein [Rubritalea tangerina]|uniref:Endonuclease/exonuclease/phosphatase family protein n=1 Tax=Rubritalea tangerina TaxID=430798 RepID=A0ABW4ZAB2_9BACT
MLPRFLILVLASLTLLQARELKVLTYNIRYDAKSDTGDRDWQHRKPVVAKLLTDYEIIGLQEALAHQITELKVSLKNYQVVGVGRQDGKSAGEHTPILFDSTKWRLDPDQHGTFWLSDTPNKPASTSWGNQIPRICTWARLIDPSGAAVYVYNTHWDHRSQDSREKAAHQLITKLQQRRYIDEPAIVMGDLNADTNNPAVKLLLDSTDWRKRNHLLDHANQGSTLTRWKPELAEGQRIDHIFCSPFLPVTHSAIIQNGDDFPGSDHHPVELIATWISQDRKELLDTHYIRETVLGKEHGGGEGFIVRWQKPAYVKLIGGSKKQREIATSVIQELNQALNGTFMRYTITEENHPNTLKVFIDHSSKLKELGKSENVDVHDNIDGFASITWTTQTKVIEHACVFIANDKASGDFLRHVMLEEITQTLGLMGDTSVFPESVTYSRYEDQGSANTLGDCDAKALRLIYGNLLPGDDALTTGIAYARHWEP